MSKKKDQSLSMLSLKEAFRYQNYLDGILGDAGSELNRKETLLDITRLHKKNSVNPDAQDVTEHDTAETPHDPGVIVALIMRVIKAKTQLTAAISDAKAGYELDGERFDIDAALATVKAKRSAAQFLRRALNNKAQVVNTTGQDFKFNAEGNQTPYTYPVEITYAERIDRKEAAATMKTLLAEADKLSVAIETAMVECRVPFACEFDLHDDLEDLLQKYESQSPAAE